ncbi:PIG-L family deacetylase [Simkania negevensis]|uniref:PIG-L family deacetylase n=1 Tax=Simkania negevensis TaxID=83561 RepID=A0ABS3AT05_9BACT|nr:PIG-L family deacetylase [Simkania negevensis]
MVDILAFGSHPDDLEFGCGGILARCAASGMTIVMADLTRGEKGTHGTVEEREQEAYAAAKLIGAQRVFLDFSDCEIVDSYEGRLEIVKLIREYSPRLVIAPHISGSQTHPDHLATGTMVRYACRYSRFKNVLPNIPIHRPQGVLHYFNTAVIPSDPDFLMDVSAYVEVWKKMMLSHETQHRGNNYTDSVLKKSAYFGALMSVEYAQGLVKVNPIVIDDINAIATSTREL